ncbi:MAG: hypothetical protein M3540_06730 [Actinomycetota bacterium]|nr:hypothetical protein [Actinomycetota bacterium]
MGAKIKTKELLAALTRVIGPYERYSNHTKRFRAEFIASDGVRTALHVQVDAKAKDVSPGQWNHVADQLRVKRSELEDCLTWKAEELIDHLATFPNSEFKQPGKPRT